MSQIIDHETGRPQSKGVSTGTTTGLVVGTGAATTLATSPAAREAVVAAGKVVLKTIANNPKLSIAVGTLGLLAYGIKRVTEAGSQLEIGSFLKFKRD